MDVMTHANVFGYAFIISSMLSIGIESSFGDKLRTLKESNIIANGFLANFIIIPVFGLILINILPLDADTRLGLLLLCICPGGLFSINFTRVANGNVKLGVILIFLLSLPAVLTTPLIFYFLYPSFGHNPAWVAVSVMLKLFQVILVPLLVGRYIGKFIALNTGIKLAKWFGTASIIFFVIFTLLTTNKKSFAIQSIETNALAFIILLIMAGWCVGWLLGSPEKQNQKTMAITTSMRNVAFCLPLANEFTRTNVIIPIIAFSAISIPMNMVFAFLLKLFVTEKSK